MYIIPQVFVSLMFAPGIFAARPISAFPPVHPQSASRLSTAFAASPGFVRAPILEGLIQRGGSFWRPRLLLCRVGAYPQFPQPFLIIAKLLSLYMVVVSINGRRCTRRVYPIEFSNSVAPFDV
jgi:hypothetical protein